MIKRVDKRGQFYLIAAIVIISLITSLVFITNYSRKTESTKVYSLAEELKIESGKALDFGATTGVYRLEELAENYSSYAGSDIQIVFIVGEPTNFEVFKYDNGIKNRSIPNNFDTGSGNLTVTLEGVDYKFKIKKGQNFYFVMSQNVGEERYVATNN